MRLSQDEQMMAGMLRAAGPEGVKRSTVWKEVFVILSLCAVFYFLSEALKRQNDIHHRLTQIELRAVGYDAVVKEYLLRQNNDTGHYGGNIK